MKIMSKIFMVINRLHFMLSFHFHVFARITYLILTSCCIWVIR